MLIENRQPRWVEIAGEMTRRGYPMSPNTACETCTRTIRKLQVLLQGDPYVKELLLFTKEDDDRSN